MSWPLFFLTGCVFLVFGTVKWNANQRKLDKKLDNETTMQTLSLMEMSTKEVDAKVEKEIKEATVEVTGDTPKIPVHSQSTMIAQFREIEDLCLNYFIKKYGRKYTFKRDIRMGKYDYDFIGVSKKDSIDLLIEIKYWKDISVVNRGLIDTCRRLNDACENYHTIAHRDFSGIVFIVTPDEQLSKLESVVERYTERALHGTNNKIMIQCVGESIVK